MITIVDTCFRREFIYEKEFQKGLISTKYYRFQKVPSFTDKKYLQMSSKINREISFIYPNRSFKVKKSGKILLSHVSVENMIFFSADTATKSKDILTGKSPGIPPLSVNIRSHFFLHLTKRVVFEVPAALFTCRGESWRFPPTANTRYSLFF
ncbi:MAG: hypothetical protein EA344_09675 [Alkalicoccus sp.]|nr:MAG: hypothetical protein EA344_09675 [Alkalicoccus sp.]